MLVKIEEKPRRCFYGKILLLLSLVPLAFLIYTVLNLSTLEITLTHPRIIVEFAIFVGLLIAGIILGRKQRKT